MTVPSCARPPLRRPRSTSTCLVVAIVLAAGTAGAVGRQAKDQTVGIPWTGEAGITETVAQIMEREAREHKPWDGKVREADERDEPDRSRLPQNPLAPAVPHWPWNFQGPNFPTILPPSPLDNPQTVASTFLGPVFSDTPGFIPPDTMGDVGPTQVVVCVNGRIRTYSKSTSAADGALNADTDVFFNSVRNGSGTSDPFVRYDPITSRWFISIINVSTPNRVLLAVSGGPVITSASSFTFYFFQHDLVGTTPNSDSGGFADYPSLGVDANALYIGEDVFNAAGTAFLGTTGFVIRKSSVLSGGPIVVTAFRQLATGAGAGPYAPRGVSNRDPAATEGYFIGVDTLAFSLLQIRRVSNPGGTPTISGNIALTVPTTAFPRTELCLGSTRPLDALDDRLFQAIICKNRGTGVSTLWTSHNINVTAAGVATGTANRNAVRWYEIQNLTGAPSLRQSGTLFDSAAASPNSYWIPSIVMSGQGHAAIGASAAGAARHAEAATAGRLDSDPLGTIQSPTTIVTTATNYNIQTSGTQRWGDYSVTTVDPTDDQSIWTIQEYCNATNSWGIRIAKLLAPPPATPLSCFPASLAQGATAQDVFLTGSSSSGSGFYDTEPGLNRIAAQFTDTGIVVNSIVFSSPTLITLNVTVSGTATLGGRGISVTNPDGQSASSGSSIFSVTAGASSCYPNCDNSTTTPILNVLDFACFINSYSAGCS